MMLNVQMTRALFQRKREIQFDDLNWAKAAADALTVTILVCMQNLKQPKRRGPAAVTVGSSK